MGRIILALFALSILTMLAGWYVPSLPFLFFTVGFCGILLSAILLLLRKVGGCGTAALGVFALFIVFCGTVPLPIPEFSKDYPRPSYEIAEHTDLIKSKNPKYLSDMIEKRRRGNYRICYVNKSASVIGLDIDRANSEESKLSNRLYPTFGKAMQAARGFECELLPSVDLVNEYKKHLDDRVLAAVEVRLNSASDIFKGGKQDLLVALLDEVRKRKDPGHGAAEAYLAAAIELGGGHPHVSRDIQRSARKQETEFLQDPGKSKPTGFYAQTATLRRIFQRDRFLAQAAKPDKVDKLVPLAQALAARPDLLRAYHRYGALNEKTTNADVDLDLEDLLRHKNALGDKKSLQRAVFSDDNPDYERACRNKGRMPGVAFWPASTSPESRLFAVIYQDKQLPSTNCMEDLIAALRTGRASLAPTSASGYYDYQLYALESLVMPEKAQESQKLLLHAKYKKRLREAFEAMLTQRRETHVKSIHWTGTLGESCPRMQWTPELSVEPCATNYLRTARAYRFMSDALRTQFSGDKLNAIHSAQYKGGLLDELDTAAKRFYGLYLVVCTDIGMEPKFENGELDSLKITGTKSSMIGCTVAQIAGLSKYERCERVALWSSAKDWLLNIGKQGFTNDDVRVIVPVLSNQKGDQVRYWTVIGTRLTKIRAYYAVAPVVVEGEADNPYRHGFSARQELDDAFHNHLRYPWVEWRAKEYVIPVQVFAEVTLGSTPPTREEFRALCDKCSSKEQVLSALKAGFGPRPRTQAFLVIAGLAIAAFILWKWVSRRTRKPRAN